MIRCLLIYLFILVGEFLSRMLKQKIHYGAAVPFYHHPRGAPIISHFFYADDIVIFENGGKTTIKKIAEILNQYGEWSKQEVNKRKSSVFFSKSIPLLGVEFFEGLPVLVKVVSHLIIRKFQLFRDRLLVTRFKGLINKVRSLIEEWKARLVFNGSRILLVKHVLQSIPIHHLSILHTPKVVLAKLKNLLSTFF